MPLQHLLRHSLVYGAILSAVMLTIIFASFFIAPGIWVDSAPPLVREAAGPMSPRDEQAKGIIQVITIVAIVMVLSSSILRLLALSSGRANFWSIVLSIFLVIQVYNLVDLLLVDWLLVATIRPSFVVFPGTEQVAAYGDYGFYLRGFVIGIFGALLFGIVGAIITLGLRKVLGTNRKEQRGG